jgi:hypothetical protein
MKRYNPFIIKLGANITMLFKYISVTKLNNHTDNEYSSHQINRKKSKLLNDNKIECILPKSITTQHGNYKLHNKILIGYLIIIYLKVNYSYTREILIL